MIKSIKHILSIAMLVLWCSVHVIDILHHLEEHEEEEVCEVGNSHFCQPHLELHSCDFCSIIHNNDLLVDYYNRVFVSRFSKQITTFYTSQFVGTSVKIIKGRGPPEMA